MTTPRPGAVFALGRRAYPLLRGYGQVVGGTAVNRLLSFATAAIVARHLGPTGFGSFALFWSVFTVLSTATGFIDIAYVRNGARTDSAGRARQLRAALTVKIGLVSAALFLAPVVLALPLDLGRAIPLRDTAMALVGAAAANVISLRVAVFQLDERFVPYVLLSGISNLLTFLAVGGLALAGQLTLWWTYVAFASACVIPAAVALNSLLRLSSVVSPRRSDVREVLGFSKWIAGAFLFYTAGQRVDIFVVAHFSSPFALGEYGAAVRLATVGALLAGTVSAVLLPRAAKADLSSFALREYGRRAAAITGVLVIVLLGAIGLVPFLSRFLFGSRYSGSVTATEILLVGSIFVALYTPLAQLLLVKERPVAYFLFWMVNGVAATVLSAVMVPGWGAVGAAIGMSTAQLLSLTFVIGAVISARRTYLSAQAQPNLVPGGG